MIMRLSRFVFAALLFSVGAIFLHSSAADEPKQRDSSAAEKEGPKGKSKKREDVSTELSYKTPEDFFVYRIELKNRFTESSVRTLEGEIAYRRNTPPPAASDFFVIDSRQLNFSCTIKEVQTKQGNRTRPFFQIGDFSSPFMNGLSGTLILHPTNPVLNSDPRFGTIDGLPWSYGELAFPSLPEDGKEEWTDQRKLVVVRTDQNRFRLVDSEREQNHGGIYGFERPVMPAVTFAVDYKRRTTKGRETIVNESIRFDGQHLEPKILVTGKGVLHFDHQLGAFKSIERDLEIEIKDDANATKYPVSIRISRLDGKDLDIFEVEAKKRQELVKKSMEERAAKQKALPGLNDREALFTLLESGDDSDLSMTLNGLMRHPDLKEDEELGKAIYRSIFRCRSVSYSAPDMLKTVWPKLHQSASIAKDYWSSFDVGLTGDVLTDETKLIRGQYVCYPMYSRWQAGEFYGAVEDVVVIRSNDHDRPLKVFRRSECRMPSPQFIDPALMDKDTDDVESKNDLESP